MIVIDIIQLIVAALLAVILGYQVLLSLLALRWKPIDTFESPRRRKFAIVIPAHNEEKVIPKTLYSLFGLIYPKKLYDLIVVADNCTDQTAKVARRMGAIVLERVNPFEKGKGYALRWAFDQILSWDNGYEGIVVFDSDSLVSGNYLDVMNYYMDRGSQVIQSSDLVIPQPGAWSSEATRIGFLLYNYVKPLGRKVLGTNIGLRGNGMCFKPEILQRYPWEAWSITEDVEYGLNLTLKGMRIDFAPEAYVWAQMPLQAENAESQRARWEMGRYPIIKNYVPKLFAAFIKRGALRYMDTLVDLVTPPLVNTLVIVLALAALNMGGWWLGVISIYCVWMWLGVAILGVLHLLIGLYVAGADENLLRSLIYIPRYALWKVSIYARNLAHYDEKNWVRTTREVE
jgi:cellulose synthase/poly-beta-1,6-N-acetylglucosamine synthase-like glycosyltransferase